MKKLVSILLMAALLLSGLAFAQGTELRLSDLSVVLNDGETGLDLSGLGLRLALAENGDSYGLRLGVAAADETVTAVTAMLQSGKLLLGMNGLSNTYCVDLDKVVSQIVDSGLLDSFADAELPDGAAADDGSLSVDSVLNSLDLAGVQALVDAFTVFLGDVMATMTPAAPVEGDSSQYYSFVVSEELVNQFYHSVAEILDQYVIVGRELNVNGTRYDGCVEFCELNPLHLSAEGVYAEGENFLGLDIYLSNGEDDELLELYGMLSSGETAGNVAGDEEADTNLYVEVSRLDTELNTGEQLFIGDATLYRDEQNGALTALEGYAICPTGELEENGEEVFDGAYFGVLAPEKSSENALQIYIGSWDEKIYADLLIAEESISLRYTDEGVEANLTYTPEPAADHTSGVLSLYYDGADQNLAANLKIEVVESDGSWLNLSGDGAVDVLALDEAQQQKLTTELMGELMRMLSALASANPTVAALLGAM